MKQIILIFGLFLPILTFGQGTTHSWKMWTRDNPLTPADFKMVIDVPVNNPVFAQFSFDISVTGFDFLTRNFNKKVKNIMLTTASWIDRDFQNLESDLRLQQFIFDLAEVHARELRKRLLINRNQIIKGTEIAQKLSDQTLKEFSEERARFEKEYNGGTNEEILIIWENDIEKRLQDLHLFRFENEQKIKIEKN